ncbi:unnamed protein product [Diplocarpon coronariae]|nr:hypothetical protein JHW43_003341 [Diplocarpon mali]
MKLALAVVLAQALAAHAAYWCGNGVANLLPTNHCPSGKPTCCTQEKTDDFPTERSCQYARDSIGDDIVDKCLGGVSLIIQAT